MKTMSMPGFTAVDSLYATRGHYRSHRNRQAINSPAQSISTVHPEATDQDTVGEEVIRIEGTAPAPWGLPWGWGPGGWGGGSGGGGTPGGRTDGGGGRGGGGGGTGPRPKPPKPPESCGYPPLHCSGPAANRGVYPGCDVTCGPGQSSLCFPGNCFFRRGPVCTCQDPPISPQ